MSTINPDLLSEEELKQYFSCPSCKFLSHDTFLECPRCGIVLSKFNKPVIRQGRVLAFLILLVEDAWDFFNCWGYRVLKSLENRVKSRL